METVAYEQALSVVEALPPEDQRRLWQWLEEKQGQPANGAVRIDSGREREMRWLAEHEAEYAGQWLALDGDRLLSHGADPHQVRAEARAQGVASPFVVIAETPNEFFSGGWL